YARVVLELRVGRGDEDRTLDVLERRGPVRLLLAVVGRQDFAARVRDFVHRVGVNLRRLQARARVPHDRLAAAQVYHAVARSIRDRGRLPVSILLVELRVAVAVNTLHRVRVGGEERAHLPRGERALALLKVRVAVGVEALNVLRVAEELRHHRLRVERSRAPLLGLLLRLDGGLLVRGRGRRGRACGGAYFVLEAALALRGAVGVRVARRVEARVGGRGSRVRADVLRRRRVRRRLVFVAVERELGGEDFRRVP